MQVKRKEVETYNKKMKTDGVEVQKPIPQPKPTKYVQKLPYLHWQ